MSFISENTPLPIVSNINSNHKESALLQFYRNVSNLTGIQLTVNSTTTQFMPTNAYNVTQTSLNNISFKNGKTAVINKTATYVHNIYANIYSTSPNIGIAAMDISNKNGDSISANAVSTKNITPNTIDVLILNTIQQHASGEELQLKWGGGTIPSGGNLEINILSVVWTIIEK